jgi:hypothetical protein
MANSRKVSLDVIIGDKVQCSVNTYVVELIQALPEEIKDKITYNEWTILNEEGRKKKNYLKATVIPSIAINDVLVFEGIIPALDDLVAAIQNAV